MKRETRFLCALTLLTSVGVAMATNMGFLRNSPMSRFNSRDHELLQAAFLKAMNDEPEGSTVTWANDRTGAGGTVTPIESFERAGARCRKATFTTKVQSLTGGGEYSFCKTAKGNWQLVQ